MTNGRLLQFSFVCVSVVSYVVFVVSLFVPHISFFCWLGTTVLRDCDMVSLLVFLSCCLSHVIIFLKLQSFFSISKCLPYYL